MARTETLRPSADVLVGWESPVENHFALVSDEYDFSGLETISAGQVDRFSLPSLPSDAASVTSLSVRFRTISGDGAATVRARLFDGTNLLVGPTWTALSTIGANTWTPALAPDGGAWTLAKVDSLMVEAESVSVNVGLLAVMEIEVLVLIEEVTTSSGRVVEVELPPLDAVAVELPVSSLVVELPRTSLPVELPATTAAVVELPAASATLDEIDP